MLDKGYRDADSTWNILTDDELDHILTNVRNDKHIKRNIKVLDELRDSIGQTTSYVFQKN